MDRRAGRSCEGGLTDDVGGALVKGRGVCGAGCAMGVSVYICAHSHTRAYVQVYYMKRISKGWVFRCYPGPWQALVERPDGSVQVLETYDQRPLLRDASKVVRDFSFQRFAIFNDRYAKGFGGRL